MSAPEPQVWVEHWPGGWWHARCEQCDDEYVSYEDSDDDTRAWAERHEKVCAAIQLARLQTRWDARDKAERALIERWRMPHAIDSPIEQAWTEQSRRCADELERAMEVGGC